MQGTLKKYFWHRIQIFVWSGLMMTTAFAGAPLWTFEPLTATTVDVPSNGTALVQYRVTNQSGRTKTLTMQTMQGIEQITAGMGVCSNPFVLSSGDSCILSMQVNGSQLNEPINDGPAVCQQGSALQCYRPSAANILHITGGVSFPGATLTVTGSPLGLIVDGATGQLTINNTSTEITATNIASDFTGTALAGNVTETGNTCASVLPGDSCTLTYTPGSDSVEQTSFSIAGDNTATASAQIAIVDIGDDFGGGVVACLNGGLNDLIAASADNSTGIEWGGAGTAVGAGAQSNTDGASNTAAIVAALGNNGGTPYAAQLCDEYEVDSEGNSPCQMGNTCYDDWFLPSGNNLTDTGQLFCLYTNEAAIGGFDLTGSYWSSTERSDNPTLTAWTLWFQNGTSNAPVKAVNHNVRCVRAFP